MSSLWTPSGEYRPRTDADAAPSDVGPSDVGPTDVGHAPGEAASEEELEAVRQIQAQIRATPAIDIVANHVVQLFELAVVYLAVATPPDEHGRVPMPDLAQAGVAIDAMTALLDGFGARLGDHEQTLRDGLSQIQMLYVQVADALERATAESPPA